MSKGLEALETIKNITLIPNYEENGAKRIVFASEIYKKQIDTIEKALNRLDELDSGAFVCIHVNRYDELEKKERALEIIKKLLIIDDDKQRIDVKNCVEMSDDEYDLLKEVLL